MATWLIPDQWGWCRGGATHSYTVLRSDLAGFIPDPWGSASPAKALLISRADIFVRLVVSWLKLGRRELDSSHHWMQILVQGDNAFAGPATLEKSIDLE